MTAATYPATNLQLTYDNDTDKWSFTEVAYNYPTGQTPSWQGYTTPDTPFPTGDGADIPPAEDEDRDPCPPGYIYDEVLKQCIPDPNYQAPAYAGEPGGGGDDQPDPEYIDFRDMSYNDMINFGMEKGYFNEAGTFIGAPESNVPFPLIKGLAQFGLNSQANRFAINFAKKGGKIWNPNEPSFIGNLYIPKNDDLAKFIAGVDTWKTYTNNVNVHGDEIYKGKSIVPAVTTGGGQQDAIDAAIKEEKLKQAQLDTERKERLVKREKDKDEGIGGSYGGDQEDRPVLKTTKSQSDNNQGQQQEVINKALKEKKERKELKKDLPSYAQQGWSQPQTGTTYGPAGMGSAPPKPKPRPLYDRF